jgi:hypothetical protein
MTHNLIDKNHLFWYCSHASTGIRNSTQSMERATKVAEISNRGSKPGERRGGRQKGTPNKSSAATWQRIHNDADPIGFLITIMNGEGVEAGPLKDGTDSDLIVPTLDQRLNASSQLSRWMPPPPRVRPIAMKLPDMKEPSDMVATMSSVVSAMAQGEITPDEAKAVADVVEIQRRVIETESLEIRIAALEEVRK